MDKGVLLVLLCLQVFLLITTFTSTDAAALVIDDGLPPDQEGTAEKGMKKTFRSCRGRIGACGPFIRPKPRLHVKKTDSAPTW